MQLLTRVTPQVFGTRAQDGCELSFAAGEKAGGNREKSLKGPRTLICRASAAWILSFECTDQFKGHLSDLLARLTFHVANEFLIEGSWEAWLEVNATIIQTFTSITISPNNVTFQSITYEVERFINAEFE